jgi:ribosomal protein L28
MAKCDFTGKVPRSGHNVPKSQHKTKRWFQPNVQKVGGVRMSTRFRRTLVKYGIIEKGKPANLKKVFAAKK